MIENFWVITKAGILIYSKSYLNLGVCNELLAGFLSAIGSFAQESTKSEIKSILMKDKKFSYTIDANLIFVISTQISDNNILIQDLLCKIKDNFLKKYSKEITNFDGNVDRFKLFDTDFEDIIIDSDISIKCQTCKKIILDEFRTRKIGQNHYYFCCAICYKYFSYYENIDKSQQLAYEKMRLVCPICKISQILPTHCNRPMHHEIIKGENKLVCWMGPECAVFNIPVHCGTSMELTFGS